MDDLITFINKRLDEDQAAAYALGGTTWTTKHLGDHDYEIHVAYEPLIHAVAPTDGIADVQREDVAEHIARYDPRRAQREVAAKRAIVTEHKHYDESAGSKVSIHFGCELCHWHSEYGIPAGVNWCETVKQLAAVWSDHPDYQPGWAQ